MTASTWTWLGKTNNPELSTNWLLTGGPGNAQGGPQDGDTAIIPGGTLLPPLIQDAQLTDNTLDLTGSGAVTFSNDTTSILTASIDSSSAIDAIGTATTLSLQGPFSNFGTIAVSGAQDSLAIQISSGSAAAGTLGNYGQIVVDGGALSISGGALADAGSLTVSNGVATIAATQTGQNNFVIGQDGTLVLNQAAAAGAETQVAFTNQGAPALLKVAQPSQFSGEITGLGAGDTIDLGVVNVTTIEFTESGSMIAIGTGGTVFNAGVRGFDTPGTQTVFTMSGTGGIAGDFQVNEGAGLDTTLTVLPTTTWRWQTGATASGNTAADFSVVSGPGNGWNLPQSGDSVINAGGTIIFGTDLELRSNTIYLGGTAGTAALVTAGDSGVNTDSPSIDSNSTITSAVSGATTPESSLLDAYGYFVNQGEIAADGPAGSSFTIAVAGTTVNGTYEPGYFINYNQIDVDAGNTMTINVGGTSELFNVGEIFVNGGSLFINAATNAVAGGYAPTYGSILISGGGTVETNVGYPSTVSGGAPIYAFADSTAGNTLKIDNLGSFGGSILGFGQNDTIDLGTTLAVGKLVYSNTTGVLTLESSGGTVLGSLLLASGNFQTGTFTVSGGTADGINIGLGADGDTILTTAVQDYTEASSGTWQTASLWANGSVPGTLDTAFIGAGSSSPFTLTTGSTPVSVGALELTSDNALLQITSNTTVAPYTIRQFAGSLEVTSGNTLTASALNDIGGTVQVDPTAFVDLTGHVTYNGVGAINNTITVNSTTNSALSVDGSLLVNGGTLDAAPGQTGGNGGKVLIGYEGSGTPATVTVQNSGVNAAVVTDTYTELSSDSTSFGVLTLNGNASWTDEIDPHDSTLRGYMQIGYNGQVANNGTVAPPPFSGAATLVVENGATLTEQTFAEIGATTDSAGSVVVSGGTWNIATAGTGGFLDVGFAGAGTLTVTNDGTVAVGNPGTAFSGNGIGVGVSAGVAGSMTVSGAGALVTDKGGANVGQSGTGDLQILNGGSLVMNGTASINVGVSAGAVGTLVIGGTDPNTGGSATLDLLAGSKGISAGLGGNGTLYVESGGTIGMSGTGGISVGQSANAVGLMVVSGSGALITEGSTTNGIGVANGVSSTGTVEIENGGTILVQSAGTSAGVGIGQGTSATALFVVTGTNSLLSMNTPNSGLGVGSLGSGTLDVTSGGTVSVTGQGLNIGTSSTGNGTVSVSGPGSSITTFGTGGNVNVGSSGLGVLDVLSGGSVTASGGVYIANNTTASNGTVLVNAGTLRATQMTVGSNGSGTLTVDNGGLVQISGTSGVTIGGFGSGSAGTASINGGSLIDTGQAVVGNTGAGTLYVENGGSLSSASYVGTFGTSAAGVVGNGAGGGTAIVSGGAWTVNGELVVGSVGQGSLDINSNGLVNTGSSPINIGDNSSTLSGSGTITVESGGTLIGGALQISNPFNAGTATGLLSVGVGGVVMLNGGTISSVIGAGFNGDLGTGSATLLVAGGTMTATGAAFDVGGTNVSGTLSVTAGGLLDTIGTPGPGGFSGPAGDISASGSATAGALVSGATWTLNGSLVVGDSGAGSLIINNGGVVDTNSGIVLGNSSGGAGTVSVQNGTLTGLQLTIGSPFSGTSSGLLSIGSLGTVSVSTIQEGGGGSITVGGTSGPALLTTTGFVNIGQSGLGASLVVNHGGTMISTGTSSLEIGFNAGSTGTVTVNGGTLDTNGLTFGSGSGALTVESGGLVANTGTNGFNISSSFGGSGSAVVQGGTLTDTTASFAVGSFNGSGTLLVESAGTLITGGTTAFADINAMGTSYTAAATVSGGTWISHGQIIIGDSGHGSLDINSDGLVNLGTNGVTVGNQTGGAGTLSLESGGTLIVGQLAIGNNVFSSGNVSVSGTGTTIDDTSNLTLGGISSNGATLAVGSGATVSVAGFVTVAGPGVLEMQGGTIDPTTIAIDSGTGRQGGYGVLSATQAIDNAATIYASGGTLTLDAPMVQTGSLGSSGVLEIDSGSDMVVNGAVNNSQTVSFAGPGTLTIGDISQFSPADITGFGAGDTIDVTGVTSLVQSFNAATDQLVLTDQVGNHYTLQFTGSLSAADFTSSVFPPASSGATLTTLVSFNGTNGQEPSAGLMANAAGDLFGTTAIGGANGDGTAFELVNNGGGSYTTTTLVSFNSALGENPYSVLIADAAGDLFGTTGYGGTDGDGTVFELVNNGGSYTPSTLVSFNGTNGNSPYRGLIANAAGDLFGTTGYGGANGDGTVFELVKTGSSYTLNSLFSFNGTNGLLPDASLIADAAGDLFGTTYQGGADSEGTVFELVNNGNGSYTPTTLVNFNGTNGAYSVTGLIADAAGDLFGTTYLGGANGDGTVFELVNHGGGSYTLNTLVSFSSTNGSEPFGNLVADAAGDLFGTTYAGGMNGDGTVFELVNTGSSYTLNTLVNFNSTNGDGPNGGLIVDAAGNLYGTAAGGGEYGGGTAFELTDSGFVLPNTPVTWSTDIAGDFDDPTKWSSGTVPGASTNATIDFADDPLVIHDAGNDTINSLTNTAGDFEMIGGMLTAGTLTNDSAMSWTGGSLVLNIGTSGAELLNATNATLTISGNGQRLSAIGTGSETVTNNGTMVVQGTNGTAYVDALFDNTGTLAVNQGTLSLDGGGAASGYGLQTSANGVLQFGTTAAGNSNVFSITGGFYAVDNTAVQGATLDVSAASAAVFADTLAIGAGRLTLGGLSAAAQGTFNQSGGTLSSGGTLTVFGAAALTGGVETGAGTTDLLGTTLIGGTVELDGNHTLLNNSRLNWSSGNIVLGAGDPNAPIHGGTLTNAAGALLYITADGTVDAPSAATLNNAGAMVVYAGAGTTAIDATLADGGVIQLQSGTLSLNGGGSANGGNIFADHAAVLQFGTTAGGVGHTFSINGVYTAPNTVVNGSTLDLSGASTIVFPTLLSLEAGGLALGAQSATDQDTFVQSGGTLSGSGTLTVYGVAGLTGGVESGTGETSLLGVATIGGAFEIDGGRTVATGSWLNWSSGNITLGMGDPGAAIQMGTLATEAGAVLYVTSGGRIGGVGMVSNAGVLALATSGTTNIDATLDNTGVIQVQSGTLSLNGGGVSNGGNLFVASGAVMQFGTTATGSSGTFAINGGAYGVGDTVVQGGTLDVSNAAGAGFSTSLTIDGGLVQLGSLTASSGALTLEGGGTLAGSQFFFVGGPAQLGAGLETGSGVTVLTSTSFLSGGAELDGNRTLLNDSTLIWTGGTLTLGGGDPNAAIHNATLSNGGTLVIEGAASVNGPASIGTGLVANTGLIEQVAGLGNTTVYAGVSNSGTISVASGAMTLEQQVSGGGSFVLSGTATLDFVQGVSGGGGISFLAPGGTLETQALGTFGAVVSGFGAGDALDLASVASGTASPTFNAGTLTVTDGIHSAAFVLTGSYSASEFVLGTDGHGGTSVTFG